MGLLIVPGLLSAQLGHCLRQKMIFRSTELILWNNFIRKIIRKKTHILNYDEKKKKKFGDSDKKNDGGQEWFAGVNKAVHMNPWNKHVVSYS